MTVFFILIMAALIATIAFPDIGTEAVKESLVLISSSVLPAMFCFMVLSRFIQKTNSVKILNPLLRPAARLLKLNEEALSCFVVGNICGYPNGAVSSSEIIKKIPSEDYTLTAVSNNVSIGFAVTLCGKGYLNSTSTGIIIFVSQFLSAVSIGAILRKRRVYITSDQTAVAPDISMCFCDSIKESAYSSLVLSGFIVFFHVISTYIKELMTLLKFPKVITVIISSITEITYGCKEAEVLGDIPAVALISFLCGFSGLCVIFQSLVFLIPAGIDVKKYVIFKIFQGICSSAITVVIYLLFKYKRYEYTSKIEGGVDINFIIVDITMLTVFVVITIIKRIIEKRSSYINY
ncbi:MAG: hypothetical protein IJS45_02180 [Clostridia bacterium]|nr:hypothetical protein [Clostridia bacterium]